MGTLSDRNCHQVPRPGGDDEGASAGQRNRRRRLIPGILIAAGHGPAAGCHLLPGGVSYLKPASGSGRDTADLHGYLEAPRPGLVPDGGAVKGAGVGATAATHDACVVAQPGRATTRGMGARPVHHRAAAWSPRRPAPGPSGQAGLPAQLARPGSPRIQPGAGPSRCDRLGQCHPRRRRPARGGSPGKRPWSWQLRTGSNSAACVGAYAEAMCAGTVGVLEVPHAVVNVPLWVAGSSSRFPTAIKLPSNACPLTCGPQRHLPLRRLAWPRRGRPASPGRAGSPGALPAAGWIRRRAAASAS